MAIERADFPLPDLADPLSAPYFLGAAAGELRLPRCRTCSTLVWYPRAACPHDDGPLEWEPVDGRGSLFSWAVVHRAFLPAFASRVPFITAVVALDADTRVRLVTNVVDAEPEELVADQPMEPVFRELSFATVPGRSVVAPMFRPVLNRRSM